MEIYIVIIFVFIVVLALILYYLFKESEHFSKPTIIKSDAISLNITKTPPFQSLNYKTYMTEFKVIDYNNAVIMEFEHPTQTDKYDISVYDKNWVLAGQQIIGKIGNNSKKYKVILSSNSLFDKEDSYNVYKLKNYIPDMEYTIVLRIIKNVDILPISYVVSSGDIRLKEKDETLSLKTSLKNPENKHIEVEILEKSTLEVISKYGVIIEEIKIEYIEDENSLYQTFEANSVEVLENQKLFIFAVDHGSCRYVKTSEINIYEKGKIIKSKITGTYNSRTHNSKGLKFSVEYHSYPGVYTIREIISQEFKENIKVDLNTIIPFRCFILKT